MIKLIEKPAKIYLTGDREQLDWLAEQLRYHPLNYWRADSYQYYRATEGRKGWDGYRYPLKRRSDGVYEALRGRKDDLLDLAAQEGIKVNLDGAAVSPFTDWTEEDIPDDLIVSEHPLDMHQREAVLQWVKNGLGIANMAVNAGKTQAFAAAAALIKRHYPKARFLYFTFSERLVKQVMASMSQFLPEWDITQFGGGKKDESGKDMVVATQAMLNKHYDRLLEADWFSSFLGLLLDESHHVQSKTAQQILMACRAFFRLGAYDSLKDKDPDKWNAIRGLCGPVRCGVTSEWLIEEGRSAAPMVYVVDIPTWNNLYDSCANEASPGTEALWYRNGHWNPCTYKGPVYVYKNDKIVYRSRRVYNGAQWETEEVPLTEDNIHTVECDGKLWKANARFLLRKRRYDEAIIQFRERNQLICDWANYYSRKGWQTLVVATRTPHVLILEQLIKERVGACMATMLFGEDTSAHRDKVFDWWKRTPGGVLITPLVKEGVSINEIKAGVIADPIADVEVARQVIGRFMRRKQDDNVCHITWFIDRQHPRYRRNANGVIAELETMKGFTFYHPCAGPESIDQALVHAGGSQARSGRRSRSSTPVGS
jgi:superfamily II DNA or RNA helicase